MYRIESVIFDQDANVTTRKILVFDDMKALLKRFKPEDISTLLGKGKLTFFHFKTGDPREASTWNGVESYKLAS